LCIRLFQPINNLFHDAGLVAVVYDVAEESACPNATETPVHLDDGCPGSLTGGADRRGDACRATTADNYVERFDDRCFSSGFLQDVSVRACASLCRLRRKKREGTRQGQGLKEISAFHCRKLQCHPPYHKRIP